MQVQRDLHEELDDIKKNVQEILEAQMDVQRDPNTIMKDVEAAKKYAHTLVDLTDYILE